MCINIGAKFSFTKREVHYTYIFVTLFLLLLVFEITIISSHLTEDASMITAFNRIQKGV